MTAKDAALRRIAIVLASLPQPVAQKLLGNLQPDARTQLRVAIQQLADVDPLERRRALDGFARSLKQSPGGNPNTSDAAEVVFSRAALNARDQVEASSSSASDYHPNSPFAFVQQIDDNQLMTQLISERPQTLAIILASLAPSHAARLLPRFDPRVRSEAMRRIAHLKEIPTEMVEEIASHLRMKLQQSQATYLNASLGPAGTDPGQQALNAILAKMSDAAPGQASPTTASSSVTMSRITPGRMNHAPVQSPGASATGPDATNRLTRGNTLAEASRQTPTSEATAAVDELRHPRGTMPGGEFGDMDSFLSRLKPDQLRDALGSVDTETAMLALCGLPRAVADAVLSLLPRKQAKLVRGQLASLAAIELRQIDAAKEKVAMVAKEKVGTVARAATRSQVPTRYHAAAA